MTGDPREDSLLWWTDCGAWLEECDLDGEIVRNAQVGVLYNNDVRIYSFSPKE